MEGSIKLESTPILDENPSKIDAEIDFKAVWLENFANVFAK
jgi:hypothetical protein